MKVLAVIPARYSSTRLPGKPLINIQGKPLLAHVYDNIKDSPVIDKTIIATDDEKIMELAKKINAPAQMTSKEHLTGTDRIIEVAKNNKEFDIILNIQGDEPQVDHDIIDSLCKPFKEHSNINMSTIKKEIKDPKEINNPNIVKVITDIHNQALYFSRSPIPFQKEGQIKIFKHIGLYGFKREFLISYSKMKQTPLEKIESLEQLRVLENGFKISVEEIFKEIYEVNTPEDVAFLNEII